MQDHRAGGFLGENRNPQPSGGFQALAGGDDCADIMQPGGSFRLPAIHAEPGCQAGGFRCHSGRVLDDLREMMHAEKIGGIVGDIS